MQRVLTGGTVVLACLATLDSAGAAQPQPQLQPSLLPLPPAVATPRDVPRPGTIRLLVDATDLSRHIMTVHETVPVTQGGDLVVHYPKWIPGNHGPTGAIELLAGLSAHANGTLLAWTRDPVDMYAFHLPVPTGAQAVELDFQFLSPVTSDQGRIVMTPDMLDLQWDAVMLYPAGFYARDLRVEPSLRIPAGWRFGTALETASASDAGMISFRPVSLNVLLDSPLYAGRNFERLDLDPGGPVPVHLDVVADRPSELAVTPPELAAHRALIQQAYKLYGSQHYDHYDFLLALSDELGGEGLEHHRSSENAVGGDYFTAWDKSVGDRDLLPHEYTHSWNGKYRRPADLWSPDFNSIPERDSLQWVYEGMTEYWGQVLAARSGLWKRGDTLDMLALEAAFMQREAGRSWRTLEDTTNNPIFVRRRDLPWPDWQRGEDYYLEGALLWLDADTLIRDGTQGRKSLDDFARAFVGTNDGSFVVSTYDVDDVVRLLNGVFPHDWAGFLRARIDTRAPGPPLDGLSRGGYRLVMTDKASPMFEAFERERKVRDFTFSAGIVLKDSKIVAVAWHSPAWQSGLTGGTTIIGINGASFGDPDDLAAAITEAKTTKAPIQLLVTSGTHYRLVSLAVLTGLQYPHLVRTGGSASLDAILAPRG